MLRGMWDLPGPGLEPVSPALAGRFLTTAPPGKPSVYSLSSLSSQKKKKKRKEKKEEEEGRRKEGRKGGQKKQMKTSPDS